ncbi:MAG TPA: tRNA (N(6)-L-threonylcarbamoyladenosine(37)-C(2))-methylthiotransferase MtaB, partial [Stellaceae bacterium]|nr:tRNA (N(6)-L-threonylcarbamoyladenosine(37)-C(2))-methylthiotransferase MtaB [Stellaceae bacterium]
SLQAGDDVILKRMKRRHSRAQAIAAAGRARDLRPDIALGADLIAGFPTESDAMFERSLDLVSDCGIAFLHVFPYSPRPDTPAARMPQLDPALVRERARRLRAAGDAALAAELQRRVGGASDVLIEGPGRGRADCYAGVRFTDPTEAGAVRRMRFVGVAEGQLIGVPA